MKIFNRVFKISSGFFEIFGGAMVPMTSSSAPCIACSFKKIAASLVIKAYTFSIVRLMVGGALIDQKPHFKRLNV